MRLKLTSIKKKVLELDSIKSATIPTQAWEITIMDTHEPLISALKPWILRIVSNNWEDFFAIWWWILETDWISLNILADMVEDWKWLNLEEIRLKKQEAKNLLEKYKKENKQMNMDIYIELEQEFLKESAKERLALL